MTTLLNEKKIEKIQNESQIAPIRDIAIFLQDKLGQKMTAYVSGLSSAKAVGNWTSGRVNPRSFAVIRMRLAYTLVKMIVDVYGTETAKAWLFGSNTRLNDEAPAYLLRHAKQIDELKALLPVARTFATQTE